MDLFRQLIKEPNNLLHKDGTVHYHGTLMTWEEADDYFQRLLADIEWRNDEAIVHGKHIITKRKVAWYGDKAFDYTYSNTTRQALSWTPVLLQLKAIVEAHTGEQFNSCLLNLYHDGSEGMAWHSDSEKELKKHGAIASLSFGAERKFAFKHKINKEVVPIVLEHGSLLVMAGTTQDHWLHRLPPTKKVATARVNLTFRTMDPN